jgi:hypothetical protein
MSKRAIIEDVTVVQPLNPTTLTADTTSATIDLAGFNGCLIVVNVGESGDTLSGSVYWDLILKDSTDDSTYAAVTANTQSATAIDSSGIFATIDAAAEDDLPYSIAYTGDKRYLQVTCDATGTHTNGTPIGCTVIKHHAEVGGKTNT